MRHVASIVLAALLLARAGEAEQDKKKAGGKPPLSLALTKVPVKTGTLRPGHEIRAEMPAHAWQAKIASDTVLFVDLDGNDQLVPGTDGLSMPSAGPFVVLLPETLLLKSGQYKFAFEGTKQVVCTPEDLGAAQVHAADASVFTEIRLRAGLKPAALDAQMSADCDKHCDYLKINNLHKQGGTVSPHQEDPSKPGYTPEGAEAGKGNIAKEYPDVRKAILGWFSTPYHGMVMLVPMTDKIGVSNKNGVCLMSMSNLMQTFGDPYVHPPDGAIGIPTALGNGENGENPNPVPGTDNGRGCGFPIIVMLNGRYTDTESAEMVDGAGRPVKGTWSTPAKPANPARPDNKGCVFFIPSKPLAPNTLHKVTIKFPGGDKPLTWSFTTGTR